MSPELKKKIELFNDLCCNPFSVHLKDPAKKGYPMYKECKRMKKEIDTLLKTEFAFIEEEV